MELTVTFFIKFAIGLHIITALFFIPLKENKFLLSFDFTSIMKYFIQKFSYYHFHFLKSGQRYC